VPEKFSTFEVRASSVARLMEKARFHASGVRGLGLLALTTEAANCAEPVARALASTGGTWIVTVAPGVCSERGDIEGVPAAVGLALSGVRGAPVIESSGLGPFGRELARLLEGGRGAFLLTPADGLGDGSLSDLQAELGEGAARVFGAGTPPDRLHYVARQGVVQPARSVAVAFDRSWLPRLMSSAGCRLLAPLTTVTKTRGRTLLEFEGIPALNALSQCAGQLDDAPLILLAVASNDLALSSDGRKLALQAIVGVDPGRGGIDLQIELPIGTRLAFAARDGHAARVDLDAHLRTLRQTCRGAAASFGIYVCSSGRGRRLYDSDDVDVRLIRSHFPDMPLLGFQSVFEASPALGRLMPQVQSGVLGVFCAPS
jgi:hypothetical protein